MITLAYEVWQQKKLARNRIDPPEDDSGSEKKAGLPDGFFSDQKSHF
jgi:hypothetical protein